MARHWPVLAAIIILWCTVLLLLILSVRQNQGHLVYALDDPYIHMAIAKNFAQHGVWGVTRYEFSSSSSSLLWTVLLSAIYLIFGTNEIAPLVLNVIVATLVVISTYKLLDSWRPQMSAVYSFAALLGVIFLAPLPALIFTGLEHILHIFFTIPFVYFSAKVLSGQSTNFWGSESVLLLTLALFLPFVRYEGLFLVFAACVLFILRGRWLYALVLGAAASSTIGIYAILSVQQGWYWLPNSVLLKGNSPDLTSLNGIIHFLGFGAYLQLWRAPHLFFLFITSLVLYALLFDRKRIWDKGQIGIVLFTATTLLHLQLAGTGWFYRYEAYLVALGVFVVATTFFAPLTKVMHQIGGNRNALPKYAAVGILAMLLTGPLLGRAVRSLREVPDATTNIYEQQYQMGLFLKQYYPGEAVAANDIGAINYLGQIHCLDVWGLGTFEVAEKFVNGPVDVNTVYRLARSRNVRIAVVYDHWLSGRYGGIPAEWVKVGEWKVGKAIVVGGTIVSFYAVDPLEKDRLIKNLRRFALETPPGVMSRTVPLTSSQ